MDVVKLNGIPLDTVSMSSIGGRNLNISMNRDLHESLRQIYELHSFAYEPPISYTIKPGDVRGADDAFEKARSALRGHGINVDPVVKITFHDFFIVEAEVSVPGYESLSIYINVAGDVPPSVGLKRPTKDLKLLPRGVSGDLVELVNAVLSNIDDKFFLRNLIHSIGKEGAKVSPAIPLATVLLMGGKEVVDALLDYVDKRRGEIAEYIRELDDEGKRRVVGWLALTGINPEPFIEAAGVRISREEIGDLIAEKLRGVNATQSQLLLVAISLAGRLGFSPEVVRRVVSATELRDARTLYYNLVDTGVYVPLVNALKENLDGAKSVAELIYRITPEGNEDFFDAVASAAGRGLAEDLSGVITRIRLPDSELYRTAYEWFSGVRDKYGAEMVSRAMNELFKTKAAEVYGEKLGIVSLAHSEVLADKPPETIYKPAVSRVFGRGRRVFYIPIEEEEEEEEEGEKDREPEVA